MRGDEDRAYRARGGAVVFAGKGSQPLKRFKASSQPSIPVDASTKRGAGPIFRKRGGRLPEAFKEHEGDPEGREDRAAGGAIGGAGAKPSAGRPGRKVGGGVGADCSPVTHAQTPRPPKGHKLMGEGEKVP